MKDLMEKDILKVLVSEQELKERVSAMGEEIAREYADKKPLFLGVLKGSCIFMADSSFFIESAIKSYLIICSSVRK